MDQEKITPIYKFGTQECQSVKQTFDNGALQKSEVIFAPDLSVTLNRSRKVPSFQIKEGKKTYKSGQLLRDELALNKKPKIPRYKASYLQSKPDYFIDSGLNFGGPRIKKYFTRDIQIYNFVCKDGQRITLSYLISRGDITVSYKAKSEYIRLHFCQNEVLYKNDIIEPPACDLKA